MRQLLRILYDTEEAPRLWQHVYRVKKPRPRNVTVTAEEKAAILARCSEAMRLWVLMCSDLAIRSGTAARMAPENYDRARGTLTFTTKHGSRMTLPVTAELVMMLNGAVETDSLHATVVGKLVTKQQSGPHGKASTAWLGAEWRRIVKEAGITRRITPHDLRRTTAVRVLKLTRDVRDVQAILGHLDLKSTLYYLDHDANEIATSTLELAKLNPATEVIQ